MVDGADPVQYTYSLLVTTSGLYSLSLGYDGLGVPGSPFTILILPGYVFGATVLPVNGSSIVAGVATNVTVQGLDSYGNPSTSFQYADDALSLIYTAGSCYTYYSYSGSSGYALTAYQASFMPPLLVRFHQWASILNFNFLPLF